MNWDRPTSLGKTIEAKATNRPVKFAYLVPFDDAPHTQFNLDAVFFESYTRWAGVYTLIVPTHARGFLHENYEDWLERFDPDFIYSYVNLDAAVIEKINQLCCPIAFVKHAMRRDEKEIDWRSFLPRMDHYIQPISSISTVHSPTSSAPFRQDERPLEPTVFTQYGMEPVDRFLADNFGTGFHRHNVMHPISGFFKTLCLVPPDLPAHFLAGAGTERCTSTLDALRAITDRKAIPVAHYAMANSDGVPRPESWSWSSAFRLFIGNSPLDRIHFWNSRHLGSAWSNTPNALVLDPKSFSDDEFVKQLGQYLNKNNFLRQGSGQPQAEIHSSSIDPDVLETFRAKLQSQTGNYLRVSQSADAPAIPTKKELNERVSGRATDTTTLKLTEYSSEVIASEPAHFIYIPPRLLGVARGQWVVDLSIQRHNNLSKYSNVIDHWILPRRLKVTRAFTDRLSKPTYGGMLALVPSSEGQPGFMSRSIKDPSSYRIHLPSDETFFKFLALDLFQYPRDDLRSPAPKTAYVDMAVSDKGQNLRGVISMVDRLATAFEILTNKYWRTVLAIAKEDSTKPLTFDMNKLESLIPNDQGSIQILSRELRLSPALTKEYLRDSLKDTLEYLVQSHVFYQVGHWRCTYCGHLNSRSFDKMRLRNECDVCSTEYLAPIEFEWKYELNDFVYRSLEKHAGLPVLWTLGFLYNGPRVNSFWYIPEVDLYEKDDDPQSKNEIDALCMLNGKFYAVEVKRSASLLNKPGAVDKFVKVIQRLRPDTALLAFERYCAEGEDIEEIKVRLAQAVDEIRERIGSGIRLEVHIAQDVAGFDDFPSDLGWHGHRVHERLVQIDRRERLQKAQSDQVAPPSGE